jgi:hypothetical protein
MTRYFDVRCDDQDPVADTPMNGVSVNLDQKMTNLEVAVGVAMWAHGKVKIPRDALTRMCLDLKDMFGDERCNLLSSTTYGQFYSGQIGVPTVHLPAADQITKAVAQVRRQIEIGPQEYRDGSCV